jgi:hypothetical protein
VNPAYGMRITPDGALLTAGPTQSRAGGLMVARPVG